MDRDEGRFNFKNTKVRIEEKRKVDSELNRRKSSFEHEIKLHWSQMNRKVQ